MSVILRVGAVKPTGGQDSHYGSGDEASSSYTDADVLDIPLPEHTYQRPLPPSSTQTHSSSGYFGLPYQDHNYGLPPPPSPPRPASPRPPSPLQVNGVVQLEEEVKTTPLVSVVEEVVEDSVTRCICGYLHDDGYMICCDKCSVWQHIDCMGVDRNNIPESYYCELCQPRILDAVKAKILQKKKREELAARNVLSDSSATDTDPEEAANALASMGRKLPASKKKGLKQKRNLKAKDKPPLKLKIGKSVTQKKTKKPGKKEKENIKATKPKKLFRPGSQKLKLGKTKNRPLLTLDQLSGDPWNSNLSPWVDTYEYAYENQYSPSVREFACNSHFIGQSVDISSIVPDQLLAQLTSVADVKKNRKGLRATQEIPAGQAIIEYKGKVMLRHDYDKEYAFVNSFKKLQPFVLFYSKLDVDLCVDARTYGNEARFVRRSCTPNAEVQHIFSQGKMYFVILSKQDIAGGSEITIPFDYNYQDCSYCVECACIKNNCVVSRYWKKLKNAQKAATKDMSIKRRRQSSGGDGGKNSMNGGSNPSSTVGSPTRTATSPMKALQMKLSAASSPPPLTSPVKLDNVSTLLAASALLDGQPELAIRSLKLDVTDTLPVNACPVQSPPPPAPPAQPSKSATLSRRGSRVSEDSVKEEKLSAATLNIAKEKQNKTKEQSKVKDKESKDHHYHHAEVKKERRPSSRRQSQDDSDSKVDVSDAPNPVVPSGNESEDSNTASDCPRKMTREERKLDAIMKAFEKMEKREERRKEALARGDGGSKKVPGDKAKKKEDTDGNISSGSASNSRSTSQDGPPEGGSDVKMEPASEDQQVIKSPEAGGDKKPDGAVGSSPSAGAGISTISTTGTCGSLPAAAPSTTQQDTSKPVKEESPQKPVRKVGKRKRRKSRVQSAAALSDAASVSTDDGNSNSSFPPAPLSMPVTPAITPVNTPMPSTDLDGGMFKYLKTKKHLFDEWSNRQEDENNKQEEEMFVQCLPNPHVNTMDHLQRRHSQSAGCSNKGTESSAGSAKKRWLRQAMHEVPAPVAFNHSLSVTTDSSGGGSPVHGGASPNPGAGLASPGVGSPLDFVTPLKKRRLMRESLSSESNGPVVSPGVGVLSENFTTNSIGITPKTNGVKQFFPAHRHSTDDRLLLHKNVPYQNGFRETVTLPDTRRSGSVSATTHSHLHVSPAHPEMHDMELCSNGADPRVEPSTLPMSVARINGISEAVPITSVSFAQPSSKFPLKFRGIFERMEVDSSGEHTKERDLCPMTSSSSRVEENGVRLMKPPLRLRTSPSKFEDGTSINHTSASTSTVVVVNSSSVYNGVNNLMDEGSEAGCVTAKSIMDEDSPATVRIDLNAHEMEPSTLSDSSAVINLDDTLFCRTRRDTRTFLDAPECQVNSSEDVVETLPLVTEGPNIDICDNACTDSTTSVRVSGLREGVEERTIHADGVEEDMEVVDSSQHVNRNSTLDFAAVFEERGAGIGSATEGMSGASVDSRPEAECISSTVQPGPSCVECEQVEEPSAVCDSLEEASESLPESDDYNRHCDSGSSLVEESRPHETPDENGGNNEDVRTCDSVGTNVASVEPSTSRVAEAKEADEEVADSVVSESSSLGQNYFRNVLDSNVDSTSSEVRRVSSHQFAPVSSVNLEVQGEEAATADSCCDSNYERQPNAEAMYENSTSVDESSSEGLAVSSSSVPDSQPSVNSSWEGDRRDNFPYETLPDSGVSTVTPEYSSGVSPSTSSSAEGPGVNRFVPEPADISMEAHPSSSAVSRLDTSPNNTTATVSSNSLAVTQSQVSMSPSSPSSMTSSALPLSLPSSSAFNSDSTLSSTTLNTSTAVPTTTVPGSVAVSVTSSPPISSTAEATPAVKKKVSLLEYRKRLKEKPASSGADTKTSSSSAASSSSFSSTHHHRLSSTLSQYLSSSSPTASSTSTSPLKSPSSSSSSSSSSSHSPRKQQHRMPTLATLPLFKSADPKTAEEKKKKPKPRPEKQLSLTDRLRLEFGLEDCEDDPEKKKKAEELEVVSSNGNIDDSVPPPPPPPTTAPGFPSPPPAAAGYVVSSTHPRTGYHGPQAPLTNGGPGSKYNYHQQQPSISSTSLNSGPPHTAGGRDRLGHGFSTNSGAPAPISTHPAAAAALYQQNQQQHPPSSSLSSTSGLNPQAPHSHSWAASQGCLPPAGAPAPHPSTNSHHGPPQHYNYNHGQPSQSQTIVSGNNVPDDHPPPPPPPPPRPLHRPSSSSSLSSSSHRHHHHQHNHHHHHHSSGGKSKSSKAASSSSHYSDKRSRY